jgi:hypothetical protein|tara:strand:+ start:46 stop:291 length:246 start_codon:yes stop_codon:yes gene_type:complete
MSQDRRRFNPQTMAKELAYIKLKINEVLTNDDMPVMGKDIEKIHSDLELLKENQKTSIRNVNILIWCVPSLLIIDILLRFF